MRPSNAGEVKNHSRIMDDDKGRRATFPASENGDRARTEGAAAQGHKIGACHASPRTPSPTTTTMAAIDALSASNVQRFDLVLHSSLSHCLVK